MHNAWQSLLWKEWHEHKWKLASLSAIATSVQLWAIWRGPIAGGGGTLVAWIVIFGVISGLFIAMGTAAGERSKGTLDFLRSLPIAPGKVLAVKMLVGATTTLLPMVPPALVCIVWAIARTHGGAASAITERLFGYGVTPLDAVHETLTSVAVLCVLFLWATAAGAGQSTELRAGLAAVTVFAAWIAVLALTGSSWADTSGTLVAGVSQVIAWSGPLGIVIYTALPGSSTWTVIACQLVVAIGLITWLRFKFMRVSDVDNRSPSEKATGIFSRARSIAPPFRSRLSALAWQHGREVLPSVVMGAVLIGSFTIANLTTLYGDHRDWMHWAGQLLKVLEALGSLLAIIVGVGTFVTGLNPAILSFWRSRPITPSAWFWTRYTVGAAYVLLILDGPVVAMLAHWELRIRLIAEGYAAFAWPLYHVMIYTVAVCAACLLRHSVYAGIVCVGTVVGAELAVRDSRWSWLSPSEVIHAARVTASTELFTIFAISMVCMTAALALLAWLAVRFDVGWKR